MTVDLDEAGGALVEAQVSNLPLGVEMYRCVYCNLTFVTDHTDCDCDPEWCPNGCEHDYGETQS